MKTKAYCFVIAVCFTCVCSAQSVEEQMTAKRPECSDILKNAALTITKLYDARLFDSIRVAVNVIKQYCSLNNNSATYVSTLLDIQQSSFTRNSIDTETIWNSLFHEFSFTAQMMRKGGYRIGRYQYYYFSQYEKDFYSLIIRWANDLLTKPGLSPDEIFICNILAGNYKNPENELKSHKTNYPDLYSLMQRHYYDERSKGKAVFSLTAGIWSPSGNLSTVGTHPTIGMQIGGRGKNNEFDLTVNFKFINTPHNYIVLRSDSLYSLNHFFGGFIGFDFAHYFYHATSFEAGLLGGIAYDGFDIADPGDNDHSQDYLKPFGIGSLNLNTGFRVNYFFNPRLFIGIVAKYNYLNYNNKGGTNMKGNAFSIDFIIGGNH